MSLSRAAVSVLACLCMAACSDPATQQGQHAPLSKLPDLSAADRLSVSAAGVGSTPGAALIGALHAAMRQVNHAPLTVDPRLVAGLAQVAATLDAETADGKDSTKAVATMQSHGFSDQVVASSHGMVSAFRVVRSLPPVQAGQDFKVEIDATIARLPQSPQAFVVYPEADALAVN